MRSISSFVAPMLLVFPIHRTKKKRRKMVDVSFFSFVSINFRNINTFYHYNKVSQDNKTLSNIYAYRTRYESINHSFSFLFFSILKSQFNKVNIFSNSYHENFFINSNEQKKKREEKKKIVKRKENETTKAFDDEMLQLKRQINNMHKEKKKNRTRIATKKNETQSIDL